MKTLLLAAVVALLCMQALHANPMPGGVSDNSESQYEISYTSGGSIGGGDGGDEGEVTESTTTTVDGGTTTTTTTTGSTKVYSFKDIEGGSEGSTSYKYELSGGSASGAIESGAAQSGAVESVSIESGTGDRQWTVGGDDKCDGGDGPCEKGHHSYTYQVTEDDMQYMSDILDEQSSTSSVRHLHDTDFEKQVEELNEDNDALTTQLITANSHISTLTTEKTWVLGQLEKCRDDYKCTSEDFQTAVSENRMLRKKYEKLVSEFGTLKNNYMGVTADNQKFKIKIEQLEGELKKTKDINIQLTVTINEYKTTVNNLRISVNELTIKNNNCISISEEWRLKFEFAYTQVTKYEVTIQNLEINIADWKVKVDKKTKEIESCQHENTSNDKEIDTLKTELNECKSKSSKLTSDLETCDSALLLVTNEYNEDEKRDHDEFVYRKKVENDLSECEKRRDQLSIDFETEKNHYAKCKSDIVIIREENTINSKKCQEDITNIKITYQTTIDTCEENLQIERNNYSQIVIQITNLNNEITLIRNELNISIKVVEEWQKKHQYCENGSKTQRETIEKLEKNIENLNGQLSTCIEHSGNTQTDLTKCVSDLDVCSDDLTDSKKKNTENGELIIKLESDIKSVETERDNCNSELTVLRCETNHILAVVDDAETKSLQAINDLKGIIEDSKIRVDQFVATQDIKCDTCSPDAPCLVN